MIDLAAPDLRESLRQQVYASTESHGAYVLPDTLGRISQLYEQGALRPGIAEKLDLKEAGIALTRLSSGITSGKYVLNIA